MTANDANPPDATSHTPPEPADSDADDSRIDLPRLLAESEERLRAKRALLADDGVADPQPVADDLPGDATVEPEQDPQPTAVEPQAPRTEALWRLKPDFDPRTGLQWSHGRLHEWPSQKPAPNASQPFRWPWEQSE